MGLRILVIGGGGREHAVSYALKKSAGVDTVYCAPGNPGMSRDGIHIVDLAQSNHAALITFAQTNQVDWVFVGPEVPLMEGIVDDFEDAGIKAFGPNKAAAEIEGSKDFAKKLMMRHSIPTAAYQTFDAEEPAREYVIAHGAPIVIKADGLAAGKGVTVALDRETALRALDDIFIENRFGVAGAKVVIEDFLDGQEFSLMSFVRGSEVWPMPIAQDHKRAHDGDKGPNTGGMGAYSPVPQIPDSMISEALETIVKPTAQAMVDEGTPFTGVLYAGLIATADGPKVIEFNARFGDPETQVVLPRLTSDFAAGISAILDGSEPEFTWNTEGATLGVVLAAEGYPNNVTTVATIPVIAGGEGVHTYYAGVANADAVDSSAAAGTSEDAGAARLDDTGADTLDGISADTGAGTATDAGTNADASTGLVSSSGRVLLVEATRPTLAQAQEAVYSLLREVKTEGMFYRTDIGNKALR